MTPMTDEQLDHAVTTFLGWQSMQLDGAPDAQAVAWRIAGDRLAPRPRWQQLTAGLAVVGLLVVALVGAAVIATRPPAPSIGPLVNGPIIVSNTLGWQAIDPSSGAESTAAPCGGLCPDPFRPVLSADGETMFFVVPTSMDGDARPTAPGWSLWRWDRDAGSTTKVHLCDMCLIDWVAPSPDGRSVALIETSQGRPGAAVEVVVVDAVTGGEVYRSVALEPTDSLGPVVPAWDAQGKLLLGRMSGDRLVRERIDLATGVAEEVGQGLPIGLLLSSPDGRGLVLSIGGTFRVDLHLVDPELAQTRPLARIDADGVISGTWAPDGTALAVLTGRSSVDSADLDYEVVIIDLATGAVTRHETDAVAGQLIWLPVD